MRDRRWPDALCRYLPAAAARDMYRPALADLRLEWLRREASPASRPLRAIRSGRIAVAVAHLWFDCLRLAAIESVARRFTAPPPAPRSRPGKDYRAMVTQDLRRALRLFRLEPGFTAAAVLTLGLGIGANTALFAVAEAILLRPLPVSDAGQLVILKHRDRGTGITKEFIALGDYIDLQARQETLDLAAYGGLRSTLLGDHEPLRLEGIQVVPGFFEVMTLRPALGRALGADDAREGAPPVVMIGYELWQSHFGGDPGVISRSIQIGNTRRMVVGVAPRGFHFPPSSPTQIITPLVLPPAAPAQRKSGWVFVVGRLRGGQSGQTASAELDALSTRFEREYPEQNQGSLYFVESLRDALVGPTQRPLLMLLAAVAFVLLIACANVGNLLLARSLARRQEMAVRIALGAARGRLAAQMVTEALVLALAGGTLGILVAGAAAPLLVSSIPDTTRVPGLDTIGVNVAVLAFSVAASLASALLFGGVSCLSLWTNGQAGAAPARRATASLATRRTASALVVAEIAMAAVLLFAAGLTLRSFANLLSVDPGFRTSHVLTLQVSLPSARYATPAALADFYARAFAALDALPEVEHLGAAAVTPLTGNNWTVPFERADQPVPRGQRPPDVGWQAASGGYFSALGIPLRAGRLFDTRDAEPAPPHVIISESLARRFFPTGSPLGHRVRLSNGDAEIVGVVGDIRRASLTDEPRADMYFPFEHAPQLSTGLFVHTATDPLQAVPSIRRTLRGLEPNVMLEEVRSIDEVAAASASVTRLAMRLLGGFALMALALAAIGIYGVLAYSVRSRTRELGTRVALGASRRDIVGLVMREGGAITLVGLAAGVIGGLLSARSLSAVSYGVPSFDPVSIAAATLVLGVTAMAACYLPARRAARVDPAETLASE
jgi:putative ABC transport system permease protein